MEDVLEVYRRPYNAKHPVVCLDETSKQLVGETRPPVATKPGQPAREDYEYKRNGTANLFMLFEPPAGWRHVEVTDRRTKIDFAKVVKKPVCSAGGSHRSSRMKHGYCAPIREDLCSSVA